MNIVLICFFDYHISSSNVWHSFYFVVTDVEVYTAAYSETRSCR